MAVLSVAGTTMGLRDKAKAEGLQEDARRRQQIEMIKQMNSVNADLRLQAKDKFEQARQQMTEVNLSAIRNKGMLSAAIGESGISGNSMERLKRVTAADSSRELSAIRDNYQRDYQAIFANQVSNVESTKSALKGMGSVRRTSKLAQALDVVSSGTSAYVSSGGRFGTGNR
jgi:hypothetical protein